MQHPFVSYIGSPMQAPTGTVTLVFTDIQDSTPLWERHGPRFEDCLAIHNRVMREQIAATGGYEVKTEGDAFMVAFARATDAARFALASQIALHQAPWLPEVGEVLVRMGLHTGEPISTLDSATGRMDYFGPAVNRAARVASAGHGGQILLSEAAHSAAAEALSDAFVRDLGEHRLKGLERPEHLFQALPRSLDQRKFVALQTLSSLPTNLPPQATSFVGREKELRELSSMLRPPEARVTSGVQSARTKLYGSGRFAATKTLLQPAWLVTLTGAGGTGKTRLALRVGNELLESFEGGVWFVDLVAARSSSDISHAVAAALGVPVAGKEAPEKLVANVLQYRKPLLLILDNFEQVARYAQSTIGLWRQAAPHVRFLATSRALLSIAGEREYELQPLPTPPKNRTRRNTAHISSFDGITLFAQRATEADSRFELNDDNAEAVAEICAELEGLPLAIELAASRVKVLKPAQMVRKLGQKFELLKSSRRDLTPRQQTMLGAIEWGYDLLTDWEKHALLQLSVFKGGFFLEAAEAVIDLSSFEGAPLVLDAVQGLREKSLLTASDSKFETRYGMYRAIRDFCQTKWKEVLSPDQQRALCRRHAEFYAGYNRDWNVKQRGPESLEALDRVELELENAFAAQDWAMASAEPRLAAEVLLPASQTMRVRGMFVVANERFEKLLVAIPPGGELQARALTSCARAALDVGEWERSQQLVAQAWEIVKDAQPSLVKATVARQRAENTRVKGMLPEALELFARATQEFQAVNDAHGVMSTLVDRGVVIRMLGRIEESSTFFAQCEELARKIGDERALAAVLCNQGNVCIQLGQLERCEQLYIEAIAIFRRYDDQLGLSSAVGNLGNTYAVWQRWQQALKCHEETLQRDQELGNKHSIAIHSDNISQVLAQLGNNEAALSYARASEVAYRELGDVPSAIQTLSAQAQYLLNLKRWQEAKEKLMQMFQSPHRMRYAGSRQELRDRANLAVAEFETGGVDQAKASARELLPLLENPPPKSDFTDESMDSQISAVRRILAN